LRPYEGLRVLDITRVLAGPYASYQLALLGADVIKIEPPGKGESTRWRTEADPSLGNAGMSLSFLTQSANKRFMTLDLDTAGGREVFLKLAANVDVIVENLRTGSMDKRGVGYEAVRALNPKIIWCAITGYGRTGPKARHAAYDSVIQGISGLMSITGTPETGPLKAGPAIVDYATGLAAAFAISSALHVRNRTGEGQMIDCPMLDAALMLMAGTVTSYMNTGKAPTANGNDAPSRAPASTTFETKEGLFAVAVNEDHQNRKMLKLLGLENMTSDPRFKDATSRRAHRDEMRQAFQDAFMQKTAAEWEPLFDEAGVPGARVRTVPEIMSEPHVVERATWHTFTAAETGLQRELKVPLTPFKLARGGAQATTPPKAVGADTDAILQGLGYSASDITRLRTEKAV